MLNHRDEGGPEREEAGFEVTRRRVTPVARRQLPGLGGERAAEAARLLSRHLEGCRDVLRRVKSTVRDLPLGMWIEGLLH